MIKKERTDGKRPLPVAQRNTKKDNVLQGIMAEALDGGPHPGEQLFEIEELEQLVIKGDIPEKMVGVLAQMLWEADRYNISALRARVRWYLLARLGASREGRKEYMQMVIGVKRKEEEELESLAG